MSKTFRPYEPDQLLALPPSLNEWLPKEHLVYFVSDLVDSLDLSAIYASYGEERGFPPYHPLRKRPVSPSPLWFGSKGVDDVLSG